MSVVFLCGPLCAPDVLAVVLGRPVQLSAARITGWLARPADRVGHLALKRQAGAEVDGALLPPDLGADEMARLAFYARSMGLTRRRVTVQTGAGAEAGIAYSARSLAGDPVTAGPEVDAHSALSLATATDVMAAYGQASAASRRARLGPLMVRAASRLRAQATPAPSAVRRAPGDIALRARREPYAHFFAVEEYDLSFRRFDGAMSPVITRAAFVSADAVTVLPYDPRRDRVLLVEQMRTGPYARGDHNPWQLEAIAGRIDPGETPEECARREAEEEAGLILGELLPVAQYYPSPGAKTEFIYSYLALADLPDDSAGVFGVEGEAEDIRGHLLTVEAAFDLITSGEIQNAPLLVSLLWLQRERPRLRS